MYSKKTFVKYAHSLLPAARSKFVSGCPKSLGGLNFDHPKFDVSEKYQQFFSLFKIAFEGFFLLFRFFLVSASYKRF